jgi:hypothetical protein
MSRSREGRARDKTLYMVHGLNKVMSLSFFFPFSFAFVINNFNISTATNRHGKRKGEKLRRGKPHTAQRSKQKNQRKETKRS